MCVLNDAFFWCTSVSYVVSCTYPETVMVMARTTNTQKTKTITWSSGARSCLDAEYGNTCNVVIEDGFKDKTIHQCLTSGFNECLFARKCPLLFTKVQHFLPEIWADLSIVEFCIGSAYERGLGLSRRNLPMPFHHTCCQLSSQRFLVNHDFWAHMLQCGGEYQG